ncbi:MAG: class I SAM-dependent methyltransferase [Candidatus Moranbacteria bacterium]|jgi:2-polyprenyl-3-methyl-5-hydroxy-6-metoxy-1,4-benzoquinol methylase|nr:class I SAM-dependent methyltransferase [Candidatus Moranbacteria bacterium]
MIKLLIQFFVHINNFSYKVISVLVVKEGKGIHPKHTIIKYHDFFIENTSNNDKVLDIGCGNGSVAFDLSKKAMSVIAIDIVRNNINTAKKKFTNNNLKYILGDATTYNFNRKFDIVILSNVLEHIEKRIEFLSKISILAPKILIRVPLLTREWLSVYKKEIGMEYRLDSTHFIEYTEENFASEISASGMRIVSYYVKFGELYAIVEKK